MKGFKNFLMQGDIIVVAVGLVIALAFSTLIKAFTDNVITPLVNAAGGGGTAGLGVRINGQLVNFGAVISAIVYFVVFMAVIYFVIVIPYRLYQSRRGQTVFGEPGPTKSCPECLSGGLPTAATRCRHCTASLARDARPHSSDPDSEMERVEATEPRIGPDPLRSLQEAHRVRRARSALRRAIARGEITASQILLDPPPEAQTWAVMKVVLCVPGWGTWRARRLLVRNQINELKTVGALTERQRKLLAEQLAAQVW